jgi:hypothetical protein
MKVELLSSDIHDWSITFVDTGLTSNIGQRLKAVDQHVAGEEIFLANHTDGLTDLLLPMLIDRFLETRKIACFISVKPAPTFHTVQMDEDGTVTDIRDVAGMQILLKPRGVITMEFPHLLRLMAENQFDTIYHEHFSYFSFYSVERIFAAHGLAIFDVEEIPTHGGSLRIYAQNAQAAPHPVEARVVAMRRQEAQARIDDLASYRSFALQVEETKRDLLAFLIEVKRQGKTVAGYGAPGKGNILLNYCGIRTDFLDYTVDRSPHKQGKFLPCTHIPIYPPDRIAESRPDYVLILPWNLRDEIVGQMAHIRDWGGRFVVPIPRVQVIEAR